MHSTPLNIMNQTQIGASLKKTLEQAYVQGRLSFGVFECAQILENDPDNTMAVILPGHVDSDDVTVRLQTTLVEAFCWEYDIRLLKIDNTKDISKILSQCTKDVTDMKGVKNIRNTDFNCILVESPASDDEFSEQDKEVLNYCNISNELLPQPILHLPSD